MSETHAWYASLCLGYSVWFERRAIYLVHWALCAACRRLTASEPGETLHVSVDVTHSEMGEFFYASLVAKNAPQQQLQGMEGVGSWHSSSERIYVLSIRFLLWLLSCFHCPKRLSLLLAWTILQLPTSHPLPHKPQSDSDLGMHTVQPLNPVDGCDCFQVLNW